MMENQPRFSFETDDKGRFTVADSKTGNEHRWQSFDDFMVSYLASQTFTDKIVKMANDFDQGYLDLNV